MSLQALDQDSLASDLSASVQRFRERDLPSPDLVVVAGSGLSLDIGERLAGPFELADWYPFSIHAIEGHPLRWELVRARQGGTCVLYLRGRLHAYQGFTPAQIAYGVRWAALLGARSLLVSNAAGGIYEGAQPGDIAVITDHLNLTGLNPLVGRLPAEWGPQFPDMSQAYSPRLRALARDRAAALGIELEHGVYAGLLGPSYETPAEVRALQRLGAGLVGMSTVLEVIAAVHLGLECLGLSMVTNVAAGLDQESLDHDDVLEVGRRGGDRMRRLLTELIDSPAIVAADPAQGAGVVG